MTGQNQRVVIIGAGPAGLTAGFKLIKSGFEVVILEADPADVGGISRTVEYRGFKFDIGGHRFFSKSKLAKDIWNDILGERMLTRSRKSRIYYAGKFYSYPLKPFEALNNLGIIEGGLCVLSYLRSKLMPWSGQRSFENWVKNRFGNRLFTIFFKTYTEKVWGMKCAEISEDWASQRIKEFSLGKAILFAIAPFLKRKQGNLTTLIETFQYPPEGPGMLWREMRRRIEELGGEIRLGCSVQKLVKGSGLDAWTITYSDAHAENKIIEISADQVISSAPIRDLLGMLHPRPQSFVNAQSLRYRDFVVVALIIDDAQPFDDNWIYIHDDAVKVGRIQNFKAWSKMMVPNNWQTCLGMEYFCFDGDDLWSASDEELIERAKSELEILGLVDKSKISDGHVIRQPKAYPVYDHSYVSHIETVRDDLWHNYPGLHLAGRNGMHKYNNQDHSMVTAYFVAENIIHQKPLYDPWQVNADAIYMEADENPSSAGLRIVPQRVKNYPRTPVLSEISRRRKLSLLLKFLPEKSRILEIGCGDGWFSSRLRRAGFEVVTLDLVQEDADIKGDIKAWRKLGIKPASFDAIVALEVIEHVDCIDDLRQICRPQGYIFLSTPHPRYDWVLRIFEACGLTQKRTSAHTNLTLLRALPLKPVLLKRPLGIHQVGLFRT